jgi:hypothetical protein
MAAVVNKDFVCITAAAQAIFEFITGDRMANTCVHQEAAAVAARYALNCPNTDIIVDMRKLNMQGVYRERLPYYCPSCKTKCYHQTAKLDAERAMGVLRQERAIGEDGVVVGVVGGEEAQVLEEAEQDQPETAPRRSRRNTRNASPRYALLYYILHAVFAYELCYLLTLCVQLIS